MKIRIGLSNALKSDSIWCRIWAQLAPKTANFPFELIAANSDENPWLTVDIANEEQDPFSLDLSRAEIELNAMKKPFTDPNYHLEFYPEALLFTFFLAGIRGYTFRRVISPRPLPPLMEKTQQDKAAQSLASICGKIVPMDGYVKCVREAETSLIFVCINDEIDGMLNAFYTRLHSKGWRFERIT